MKQLGEAVSDDEILDIGEMLISNLDQNGFFILPLEKLFENETYSRQEIDEAVKTVQSSFHVGSALGTRVPSVGSSGAAPVVR